MKRRLTLLAGLYGFLYAIVPAQAGPDHNIEITKIYQSDYSQKMDNSNHTIAQQGCTMTSWTMLINRALVDTGLHAKKADGTKGAIMSLTPAQINTLLNDHRIEQKIYKKDASGKYVKENGQYVVERTEIKNGWGLPIGADGKPVGSTTVLNMGALFKAVKNYVKDNSFENKGLVLERFKGSGWNIPAIGAKGVTLDKDYKNVLEELAAGRPVVVRTYDDRHSVLVKSFHGVAGQPLGTGRYDIADPWKKSDGTSIEWLDHADYKSKIWTWGTGVFKAGGLHYDYEIPSDYWIDPDYIYDLEMNPDLYGPQEYLPSFPVPEPMTITLLGLSGLALLHRRRA